MHKSVSSCLVAAALTAMGSTSTFAQATSNKAPDNKPAATTQDGKPATTAAKKDEKPATPTWVVVEEEWWSPVFFDFSNSLHRAYARIRARDEKVAADEIDKAAAWIKAAESHADKSYQGDLSIAHADLKDFAMTLRQGGQVPAAKVANAFKNASAALAKHHHFLASKALAESDMKTAGQQMMAAADHLREAAHAANRELGNEIVSIYNHYSPFGYWDETVVTEKSALERNLSVIATELKKLGSEMESNK